MEERDTWKGPEAVNLTCSKCGVTIYSALRRDHYVWSPGSERHVEYEIHTDVEPVRCNTVPLGSDARQITCINRCMGWKQIYLVKERDGATLDRSRELRFSVACGRDLAKSEVAQIGEWVEPSTGAVSSYAAAPPRTVPGRAPENAPVDGSVLFTSPPGVDLVATRLFMAQEEAKARRQSTPARRYDLMRVKLQEGICGGFAGVQIKRRIVVERDELSDEIRVLLGNGYSPVTFFSTLCWQQFCELSVALEQLFTMPSEFPAGCEDIYGINAGIAVEARDKMGLKTVKRWENKGPSGCVRTASQVHPTAAQRAAFKSLAKMIGGLVDAPFRP